MNSQRDEADEDAILTFVGDDAHWGWGAYVAANLAEALKRVPDTGDWHGAVRMWCERNRGDVKPNPMPPSS